MQNPTRDNGPPAPASDPFDEAEDDSLPQDLSLGELDFTSQDISLKGMPHCSRASRHEEVPSPGLSLHHYFRRCGLLRDECMPESQEAPGLLSQRGHFWVCTLPKGASEAVTIWLMQGWMMS